MWELAWYVVVGFVAGLLDYSAGVGFGLVASVMLVSLSGADPRIAASVTSLVQIVNAIPVTLNHYYKGNISISRYYIIISLIITFTSSIGALLALLYYIHLPLIIVKHLFVATIIFITILSWLSYITSSNRGAAGISPRWGRVIAALGGFVAGVEKAVSGGGFSVVLVLIQRAAGIDIRSAIAGLPIVKLIPFSLISLFYISSGFFDLTMFASLLAGGLASALLAPKLLKRIDERISLAIVSILSIVAVLSILVLPLLG